MISLFVSRLEICGGAGEASALPASFSFCRDPACGVDVPDDGRRILLRLTQNDMAGSEKRCQ